MKFLSKSLVIAALLTTGFFLIPSPVTLAADATQVIHETDNGSVINLTMGQKISFSLAENTPNTTTWSPFMLPSAMIQQTSSGTDFDFSQTPALPIATTYSFVGIKTGQTVLLFFKNGTSTDTNNAVVLKDGAHPIEHLVSFIVNVN